MVSSDQINLGEGGATMEVGGEVLQVRDGIAVRDVGGV